MEYTNDELQTILDLHKKMAIQPRRRRTCCPVRR